MHPNKYQLQYKHIEIYQTPKPKTPRYAHNHFSLLFPPFLSLLPLLLRPKSQRPRPPIPIARQKPPGPGILPTKHPPIQDANYPRQTHVGDSSAFVGHVVGSCHHWDCHTHFPGAFGVVTCCVPDFLERRRVVGREGEQGWYFVG